MLFIKKADLSDAMQLSLLAEETFRATFGVANTAEHMELHCSSSYGEKIQAEEISDSSIVTLLCMDDESLIGFAQLKWGEVPNCVTEKNSGEIQRLYVANHWHGKGVAQELMAACIEQIKQRGSDAIWLGVWENNPRAISFYKKLGFVEVGDHIFPLGGDPQRDIVMVRPITAEH